MRNAFALALAAADRELTIRNQIAAETFRPGKVAEMRLAINAGCLDRFEANADAGVVDRLAADGIVVEPVGDVTRVEEPEYGVEWDGGL